MRLSDTTLFLCLARNLNYIRRKAYKQNILKIILLLRRKNYDNTKTTRLAANSDQRPI